jgi:hypothetical protein
LGMLVIYLQQQPCTLVRTGPNWGHREEREPNRFACFAKQRAIGSKTAKG